MKPPDPQQIAAWVDATTSLHGIDLDPVRRAAVVEIFGLLSNMAALVDAVPLPEDSEPAPVYRP